MNEIDEYQTAKQRLAAFDAWAGLIGKEYFGGTRGKGGCFGEVVSASGTLTIYHQAYDGARNYHDLDEAFRRELATAMKVNSPVLINHMHKQLEAQLNAAKERARKLTEELQEKEPEEKR